MVPDYIQKEVRGFSIAYGLLGIVIGIGIKFTHDFQWNTAHVIETILAAVACYLLARFLKFKLGPYNWIPWIVLVVIACITYLIA